MATLARPSRPSTALDLSPLSLVPGSPLHRALLVGGVAGSLAFTASYLLQGAVRPGYDAFRDTISGLSLGPLGWVQIASFVLFGLAAIASAPALHASLAPGRGASAIPVLKLAQGVTLILAGLFVTDPLGTAAPSLHGIVHNLASYVALSASWLSGFLFAARFASEPDWRGWAAFAIGTSVAVLLVLAGMGLAIGQHGPVGLFERLASTASLPFSLAVTIRLLARGGRIQRR